MISPLSTIRWSVLSTVFLTSPVVNVTSAGLAGSVAFDRLVDLRGISQDRPAASFRVELDGVLLLLNVSAADVIPTSTSKSSSTPVSPMSFRKDSMPVSASATPLRMTWSVSTPDRVYTGELERPGVR